MRPARTRRPCGACGGASRHPAQRPGSTRCWAVGAQWRGRVASAVRPDRGGQPRGGPAWGGLARPGRLRAGGTVPPRLRQPVPVGPAARAGAARGAGGAAGAAGLTGPTGHAARRRRGAGGRWRLRAGGAAVRMRPPGRDRAGRARAQGPQPRAVPGRVPDGAAGRRRSPRPRRDHRGADRGGPPGGPGGAGDRPHDRLGSAQRRRPSPPRRARTGSGWAVTSERVGPDVDRDGVPWPDAPMDQPAAGGNVRHLPRRPGPQGEPAAAGGVGERGLVIEDLADVAARVDAAGPPAWLIEGLWPADAYGVLAAEDKAGKTWAALDLAISVAAGHPWFGRFACPIPGRVLVFLGEGGERSIVRRLRAISAHKAVDLDQLAAEPKLRDGGDLAELEAELGQRPARLVILDPLYLAAAGQANGGNLYEMGALLTPIQAICQAAGAALVVVTHWNKTGEGTGPKRITGAGPSAWGRVLASAAVAHRGTTPQGASAVVLGFELVGGEIPDTRFRVRRTVRAVDPADLASRLEYAAEVLADDDPTGADPGDPAAGLRPSCGWVLAALRAGGPMQTVKQLGDATAAQGHALKQRTIQAALTELEAAGLAEGTDDPGGRARYWSPVTLDDDTAETDYPDSDD